MIVTRMLIPTVAAALVLAGCSSTSNEEAASSVLDGTTASQPASGAAAPTDPWTVFDCSGTEQPYGANEAEGEDGTSTVQVANVSGIPYVYLSADAQPATDLEIVDTIPGDGAEVAPGATVTVNYCGIGQTTRTIFDSSYQRGEAIPFSLDGVIPGFAEGLVGMKVGGQRLLVMPGSLGYGENPPPGIEPNETLIFVVDMIETS